MVEKRKQAPKKVLEEMEEYSKICPSWQYWDRKNKHEGYYKEVAFDLDLDLYAVGLAVGNLEAFINEACRSFVRSRKFTDWYKDVIRHRNGELDTVPMTEHLYPRIQLPRKANYLRREVAEGPKPLVPPKPKPLSICSSFLSFDL